MVNDTIADFLTRIRNAQHRKLEMVEVPSNRMLVSLATVLKDEGFIEDFSIIENDVQPEMQLKIRYVNGVPAIRELVRVSKPGIRKYRGYKEIKPIKHGLGISIFSTPKGVMTGETAIKNKIGGEYICDIY
jgi:small subunit ribosomal protein S8